MDNTFMTPILQQPLELGADISVYSTTKFIEGHSVALGGAVICRDDETRERLQFVRKCTGGIQTPFNAWLTIQGLKTLPLRIRRQSETADRVAKWLLECPRVSRVCYPTVNGAGPSGFVEQQHLGHHGAVVAFELAGGAEPARRVLGRVEIIRFVEHVGSVDSLITHPATMTHADVPPQQRESVGVTDGLLRLSVGLEDADDIIADIDQAIDRASRPTIGKTKGGESMSDKRLIVLKFGGSVLLNEATLRLAVHEIYRWRRDGYQVVAVVSALAGQTDALLRKSRQVCIAASQHAVAALVSNGELQSAALLGLHLDRAGVPACVLTPSAIRLVAKGLALDAAPVDMDIEMVRAALSHHGVVVVPGYVATDSGGRTVLMGRGGSDLTALFLAYRLGPCECRLVKDVDGLYECDPDSTSPAPKRYGTATWEDAMSTDGSIVQHKAVEFAREHRIEFQLGRLNGTRPTLIGPGPTTFSEPDQAVPLRVALLGFGTVGGGVFELLEQLPDHFKTVAVAVREPARNRTSSAPPGLLTSDVDATATCGADVVVEVMGGVESACTAIQAALRTDAHVVTANKTLIAEQGRSLKDLANSHGVSLRHSAAVGGSMPLLEHIGSSNGKEIRHASCHRQWHLQLHPRSDCRQRHIR